jgi:hypothetical protein
MARWARGAEQVEVMLQRDELQQVAGGPMRRLPCWEWLNGMSMRRGLACRSMPQAHMRSPMTPPARRLRHSLLTRGFDRRPAEGTSPWSKQPRRSPNVPGLKSLDRLCRRRNQAEYPDPAGYDPITMDEAHEAISVASQAIDTTRRIIDRPEIGMFR